MKLFTLYGLRKPGEETRYIGITCQSLKKRLIGHTNRVEESPHKNCWIAQMRRENLLPEITPYCVGLTEPEACQLEIEVIRELRNRGVDLVNTSLGGNLPPSSAGKKRSPETVQRIVASRLGEKNPNFGKTASQETRDRMSMSHKGKHKFWAGKTFSQEHKEKMSAAQTLAWEKRRQESYLAEMWGSRV